MSDFAYGQAPKGGVVNCKECDDVVVRDGYDNYPFPQWVHTTVTEDTHKAHPKDWCIKCGTVGSIKMEMQAWYDYVFCTNEECDYKVHYSIGD